VNTTPTVRDRVLNRTRSGARLLALCLLTAFLAIAFAARGAQPESIDSCVLIDNDYDIDDMMAIPLVIGNAHVAAIVQSEGYTLPEQSAPALDQLINHLPDQPGLRKIPIIVGGKLKTVDIQRWPWLSFFRSMMNQSNALLPTQPSPWPTDPDYVQKVKDSLLACRRVSVLIIGTYTSFVNYAPVIREKIEKVVIMGQAIGDESRRRGRHSFNCAYDLAACQTAMQLLQGLNAFFVDIPRDVDVGGVCANALTPSPECYTPSHEMVAGGNGAAGLVDSGLPGRLKQALTRPIDCQEKFTPGMPNPKFRETVYAKCSALSTWVPAHVSAGPGGEMLLWDQTAALFLIHPEMFSLYHPFGQAQASSGKHWEPTLVDGSHALTAQALRVLWTRATNRAAEGIFRRPP
jgi:inosine-uridine nucleoside N-ribohydrolase